MTAIGEQFAEARDVLLQHTYSDYTHFQCHCAEGFFGPAEDWADHVIAALARAGHRLT